MKRKSLLFLLLFALLAPWAANAQEKNLTVYEGTSTSGYVPFNGLYADYGTRSQFIIPASEIEALASGTISKLTFYSNTASLTYDEGVTVYMKEVDYTTFASAALEDWSTMTSVYTGTIGVTDNQMVIELSTPYTYQGGNLMIGFQVTTWGSSCPSSSWLGVNQTSGTYTAAYNNANSSHTWSSSVSRVAFIPKTTFTYTGGTTITCFKPTDLAASNVTTNAATLTWQDESADPAWTLQYSTSNTFAVGTYSETSAAGTPTANLSGLTSATTYYARVKPNCDTDGTKWSSIATFNTQCAAYDIPYTYGFEDAAPFACWTVISGNITRISGTPNTGSYRLDFRGTTSNMIALPQFNEATNNLRVEFWTRPESTGGSSGKFAIGYMTDITDASTFVAVETYNSTEMTTTYVKKTVDFANVPANANIAMRQFDCSTNYYWYVDDVTVKEIPSCLAPTGLAANASTTSAVLSWTANSGETAWTLYWKKTTDENYTEVANATNPYTLSGLDAATNYQYYVVANCSADEASEPSEVFAFVTECEAISTYPWTENFDSYTGASGGSTNNLPLCWNYINTSTYSYYKGYPVIYSASGYSHSGNNHLRFYSYYSSSYSSYDPQDQYAILPEMENLNGKQLSLFARGANTNSSFKVGLMTDPTDVSTFVEIATTTPTTGYVEYTYNLTGTGNYIAIMMEAANSTATSRTVYIDDITIAEPPACPKPTDLTVVTNSVTPHSVQLSWVSDASAWIVAYKTADDADFTEVNATENPFTLTGLTDGKTYTAKVCAVCDGTPGEWTSTTVSFTTPIACPAPTNLAYSGTTGSQTTLNWSGTSDSYDVLYRTAAYAEGIYENFGTSIPSGWEMYTGLLTNGTATLTPSTYVWSFGTGNGVFDNHARVNIYDNNQRWLVTKAFTVSQDASTLSFDLALTAFSGTEVPAPATTGTDDKFIVLISTNNMNSWIPLREWNNSGSEYVYNNIANTATGENVSLDLSAYVGQRVRIAFYGESTTSNADNNLHIDNVHCGIPHEAGEWQTAAAGVTGTTYTLTGLNPETDYDVKVLSNCEGETGHETMVSFTTEAACMVPNELEVVSVTTTTAVLTWTSSSTAWQIQVNEDEPFDVTENPYTLEELNPATTYTIKVRANCDGTYTEWSNAVSFTTDCDVIAAEGYRENFDSYEVASNYTAPSARVLPTCWSAINTTTYSSYKQLPSIYYYSSTNYANTTPNCLKFYSVYSSYSNYDPQPQYAILPEMTGLAGMQVTLKARGYNTNSTFKIGTMSDPTDASTFTMIVEQTELTTSYQEFEYLVPADCRDSYLAIMIDAATSSRTYNGVYIDDIVIATPPTCIKPTDLEVTATTTTTATLRWTNGAADQTAWQICLNGDETNLIMANSNPFTVEDLTASTAYTAKVRAYCGEEDQSDWSNEVSFATECEPYTITAEAPYTQDFESPVVTTTYSQVGEMPVCWDNYPATNASAKILAANVTYNYAESGQVLYFYGSGNNYAVLPEFTNALNTLQISFKYATENNSYGTLTLGYITDEDENYNSFTAIEGGTFAASSDSYHTFVDVDPIDLSALPANATRLVFRWYYSGQWGCNVDDVEVSLASAPSTVTQTIELVGGWNWFSTYIDMDPVELLEMFEEGLGEDAIQIKSKTKATAWDEDEEEWSGGLQTTGLTNDLTYMVQLPANTTLTVTLVGPAVATESCTINLQPGWNWIGFPSAVELDVNEALANFEAMDGDQLKTRNQATAWDEDEEEWSGSLNTLVPGQGLMFYSAATDEVRTLVFNAGSSKGKAAK